MAFVAPEGALKRLTLGAKLILMADLADPVSCASLGHLLVAQYCHLCLNVCFSPPTAPHPPPLPIPPTPYRLNP